MLRALLFLVLNALTGGSDAGNQWDPNGTRADSDAGSAWDPNG